MNHSSFKIIPGRFILAACLLALAAIPAFAQTPAWTEDGVASWYGAEFQGKVTASGETFDTNQLTAAHRTLPFGTRVVVTNLTTGASTTVRITDRGPFVAGRMIDLSQAAARAIDMVGAGTARVRLSLPQAMDSVAAPQAQTTVTKTVTTTQPVVPAATQQVVVQTVTQTVVPTGPRTIQIASFSSQVNARNLVDSLAANGLAASIEASPDNAVWRVVITGVDPAKVDATVDRLRTLGLGRVLVRQH